MIEKMVLEEFGRCLLSIIHTANGTKGEFVYFCILISALVIPCIILSVFVSLAPVLK